MASKSKQSKRRENVISSLSSFIQGLVVAEKVSIIPPAKAAFGAVRVILTMIRVSE